jgi:probable HAF family extracellular repeat protein
MPTPRNRHAGDRSTRALFVEQLEQRCLLSYSITDLGTLGGLYAEADAINSTAQVLGVSSIETNETHSFLWDSTNGMRDLGDIGFSSHGMNDSAQLVGSYFMPGQGYRAFLWDDGTRTDLGIPNSAAAGINDLGQVVGYWGNTPQEVRAFLYYQGTVTDLGVPPGYFLAEALAINASGQVAAAAATNPSHRLYHAFIWDQGIWTDLGTLPGAPESFAHAINASGQVVGESSGHAFLWDSGVMTDLGTLPGFIHSVAYDVNAAGLVVGLAIDPNNINHAFLWDGHAMVDLNDLMPPDFGWTLTMARGINDAGQIAATGHRGDDGEFHAFLLTPDQAPLFTSASSTTFTVGTAGSFTVTTSGMPVPALSASGTFPDGVTFTDNGDGTGTLSGTPSAGTDGTYELVLTASNGIIPDATQDFTLTVVSNSVLPGPPRHPHRSAPRASATGRPARDGFLAQVITSQAEDTRQNTFVSDYQPVPGVQQAIQGRPTVSISRPEAPSTRLRTGTARLVVDAAFESLASGLGLDRLIAESPAS